MALLRSLGRSRYSYKHDILKISVGFCRDRKISTSSDGKVFGSVDEVLSDIGDGSSVMIGGFIDCGRPEKLIDGLIKRDCKDLTIVSTDMGRYTLIPLIQSKKIKRIIASYIGGIPYLQKLYLTGQLELEMTPQGTLAEKIRAGGAGIPAFYTPTGFGTIIQDGSFVTKFDEAGYPESHLDRKAVKRFEGKDCVLEKALTADFSIIKAWKIDKFGNMMFRKLARSFNPIMSKSSKVTIVEAEEIVEVGELDPEEIHVSGIYVDRIVKGDVAKPRIWLDRPKSTTLNEGKDRIVRRAALEFRDGMCVNLGIGLPTMVGDLIPKNITVIIHADHGVLGTGAAPPDDKIDPNLVNAGGSPTTILPGASFFGCDESFGMVRGGHVDLTMMGGMQVSEKGDLANWYVPKSLMMGIGGAMDLVSHEKTKVVITMMHKANDGSSKIVSDCTLPITGRQCVDLVITDLAVFEVNKGKGLKLIEIAPNFTVDDIVRSTACNFDVSKDLKVMSQAPKNGNVN